jgi:hypothetical protein
MDRRAALGLLAGAASFLILPADALARRGGSRGMGGSVRVRPYTRKDGTYVGPHFRTRPDSSKSNNWSTKGNINPYTGKPGTKNPW